MKKLIIVESPNKVASIRQFVGDDYIVMASVGHITKIADSGVYNMGIDVDNDFTPNIIVDPNKKEVVKKLKEVVKNVDSVILMSDPDREGEAIAYNLKNVLKLKDNKYERTTVHEITKPAVEKALLNTRKIDDNMYNAAITRAILDKIVGYRVSPISLTKTGCKSVGRVQSATLKILAMREDEINNFIPQKFYEIWLPFKKNEKIYKAQYKGTAKKKLVSIPNKEDADKIIKDCEKSDYILKEIISKERNVSTKPPFTTSTFQQEVSSKLGLSSDKAMSAAQKLFEGININGSHVALITYIRTDSTDMSPEFVEKLNDFVKKTYGKEYFSPVKKGKKGKNTQDGHEALRVVDLDMTPEKLKTLIDDSHLIKVYKIIYERTVASAMADCIMTDNEYCIFNGAHKFSYSIHDVKFDGFKKVYGYKEDDENDDKKYPTLDIDEKLVTEKLELLSKETTPPGRYTEATLIKKMEDTGIGRPSTFASTMKTIQDPDRGYTEKDGKYLKVTDKGMLLSKFLDDCFGDIINLSYTSEMEENLDKIAEGKLDKNDFLKSFYDKLCEEIKVAKGTESKKPEPVKVDKICPKCGKELVIRKGRYGNFIACSGFPKCKYTEQMADPNAVDQPKEKVKSESIGFSCPTCGSDIVKRPNKNGEGYWYACSAYPKHKKIFTESEIKKIVEKQSTKFTDIN